MKHYFILHFKSDSTSTLFGTQENPIKIGVLNSWQLPTITGNGELSRVVLQKKIKLLEYEKIESLLLFERRQKKSER